MTHSLRALAGPLTNETIESSLEFVSRLTWNTSTPEGWNVPSETAPIRAAHGAAGMTDGCVANGFEKSIVNRYTMPESTMNAPSTVGARWNSLRTSSGLLVSSVSGWWIATGASSP